MIKPKIAHKAALAFFVLLPVGVSVEAQNNQVKHILRSIQKQYAPDKRITVFDISCNQTKSGISVCGEIDDTVSKRALIDALRKSVKGEIYDSIQVLPDPALGNTTNGIVIVGVGNVWCKPGKEKELTTQVLMGTAVKLLKSANGYLYIQMPDRYLGWLNAASVHRTDQAGLNAWNAAHKVIFTELSGIVRKKSEQSSVSICDIVAGCVMKSSGSKNGWTSVEFADGRKGFVEDRLIRDLDEWKKSHVLSGENLEKTAKMLLGRPYLWGGTSVKAMDCSGFVKTIFRMNGMELNRDADQQAEQGTNIEPGKNFKNLRKGDLVFFGKKEDKKHSERITHVGLYLENGLFVHSSGKVRLSSFDPESAWFDESLLKRFVRARRIIQK